MKKVLTKIGFEKAKSKLQSLQEERKRLIIELDGARSDGDWAENSALDSLKNQLQVLENQLIEVEQLVANAKVVDTANNGNGVGIGSKVALKINSGEKEIEIVSDGQADPLKGQISHGSPLAQALLGRKKGEEVKVETPGGVVNYCILSITN